MSDAPSMIDSDGTAGDTQDSTSMGGERTMEMAPPMQADPGDEQAAPGGSDVVELTSSQPPDPAVLARCQALITEVERRESEGLFDDEGDEEDAELSEEEIEQYQHEPRAIDGFGDGVGRSPDVPGHARRGRPRHRAR